MRLIRGLLHGVFSLLLPRDSNSHWIVGRTVNIYIYIWRRIPTMRENGEFGGRIVIINIIRNIDRMNNIMVRARVERGDDCKIAFG